MKSGSCGKAGSQQSLTVIAHNQEALAMLINPAFTHIWGCGSVFLPFLTSAFYWTELNFHWNKKTILYHQCAPFPNSWNPCSHLVILRDVKSMSWKSTSFTEMLFPACSIAQEDTDSFPKTLPQKTPPVGTGADLGSGACSAAPPREVSWADMTRGGLCCHAVAGLARQDWVHTPSTGHQAQVLRGSGNTRMCTLLHLNNHKLSPLLRLSKCIVCIHSTVPTVVSAANTKGY